MRTAEHGSGWNLTKNWPLGKGWGSSRLLRTPLLLDNFATFSFCMAVYSSLDFLEFIAWHLNTTTIGVWYHKFLGEFIVWHLQTCLDDVSSFLKNDCVVLRCGPDLKAETKKTIHGNLDISQIYIWVFWTWLTKKVSFLILLFLTTCYQLKLFTS
jgi:hypothetical protein